ncbi:MAG TPA: pyruvate dehydrogenase (acetyl-transferring), homodimeric type, partial [Gemmataceae bacterium]|nr:pyruvate dehydrogenase (acetyl-transferring), homodimeric type [Gemmataceae bacterium]
MLVSPEVLASRNGRPADDADPQETAEWLDAMEAVLQHAGPERAQFLLESLLAKVAKAARSSMLGAVTTPYVNTIPAEEQPAFPGDRQLERRIKSVVRWNAMAMVLKANKNTNVGGHISTFASAATLYDIGFNHFFRGRTESFSGDVVFFQGHASPGMYARA